MVFKNFKPSVISSTLLVVEEPDEDNTMHVVQRKHLFKILKNCFLANDSS